MVAPVIPAAIPAAPPANAVTPNAGAAAAVSREAGTKTDGAAASGDLFSALIQALAAALPEEAGTEPQSNEGAGDVQAQQPSGAPVPGRGKARPSVPAQLRGAPARLNGVVRVNLPDPEFALGKKDDSRTVPVTAFLPALPSPLPLLKPHAAGTAAPVVKAPEAPLPQERVQADAPALEVRIKEPAAAAAEAAIPLPSAPQPLPQKQVALDLKTVSAPADAASAQAALQLTAAPAPKHTASPAAAEPVEHIAPPEPLQPAAPATPLRSMALEFTPDGARDVKLRLSERAGEVHISVHSTDPALTGVLKEGVHDLAGALAHAGYEAEAWASGQHQQQQQQEDQRQQRRSQRRSDEFDSQPFDLGIAGVAGNGYDHYQ